MAYLRRARNRSVGPGFDRFGEYFTYSASSWLVGPLLAGLFFQLGIEQRLRENRNAGAPSVSRGEDFEGWSAEDCAPPLLDGIVGSVGAIAYAAFLL